jgi:hypothetical protein
VVVGRYSASGFCLAQLAQNWVETKAERNSNRRARSPARQIGDELSPELCALPITVVGGRLTAFAASLGARRLRGFIRGHIDGKDKPLAVAADRAEAARDRARQSEKHLWGADPEHRGSLHISGHHHEVV